jgi:hypothetical protein
VSPVSGLGDAQQQHCQPAELDVCFDAVLAAVVGGSQVDRVLEIAQAEHDDMGDLCVGVRARVPPPRASYEATGARFASTEGRLPTTAVNLTQIDSPLSAKIASLSSLRSWWPSATR